MLQSVGLKLLLKPALVAATAATRMVLPLKTSLGGLYTPCGWEKRFLALVQQRLHCSPTLIIPQSAFSANSVFACFSSKSYGHVSLKTKEIFCEGGGPERVDQASCIASELSGRLAHTTRAGPLLLQLKLISLRPACPISFYLYCTTSSVFSQTTRLCFRPCFPPPVHPEPVIRRLADPVFYYLSAHLGVCKRVFFLIAR